MRIVHDGCGSYAIARYRWIFTQYMDMKTPGLWWFKNSEYYLDCWGTFDEVKPLYGKLNPNTFHL
jgi:hypothetical protein